MIDAGKKVEVNKCTFGYLSHRIVFYLLNLHIKTRRTYFARVRFAIWTLSVARSNDGIGRSIQRGRFIQSRRIPIRSRCKVRTEYDQNPHSSQRKRETSRLEPRRPGHPAQVFDRMDIHETQNHRDIANFSRCRLSGQTEIANGTIAPRGV